MIGVMSCAGVKRHILSLRQQFEEFLSQQAWLKMNLVVYSVGSSSVFMLPHSRYMP